MGDCCDKRAHAQIEYTNQNGVSVETLICADTKDTETREMLHDMLDEWIDRRKETEGAADHFIVFGRWPAGSEK